MNQHHCIPSWIWTLVLWLPLLVLVLTGFGALCTEAIAFSGFTLIMHVSCGLVFSIAFTIWILKSVQSIPPRFMAIFFWASIALMLPVILSIVLLMVRLFDTEQMYILMWVHMISSLLFLLAFIPVMLYAQRGDH